MSAKMREDARDLLEREALERGKLSEGKREGVVSSSRKYLVMLAEPYTQL